MEVNNSVILPLSKISVNRGQIEGLKKNPRKIRDESFNKIKKSIEDNPEMLALREILVYPHKDRYVIIGGEMRYRALKELGYTEVPCKIIPPETTVEKLTAYVLKDNSSFGQWDYEELKDWDVNLLEDCDIDISHLDNSDIDIDAFFNANNDEKRKEEYINLQVMIPEDLSDKTEEIKEALKAICVKYNGVIVK